MQHTKYFKSYNLVKFLIKSIVVVLGKRDFAYHIRKDVFPKIKTRGSGEPVSLT